MKVCDSILKSEKKTRKKIKILQFKWKSNKICFGKYSWGWWRVLFNWSDFYILKSCPHLCWHMHIHKLEEKERSGIYIFFGLCL